MNHRFKYKIWTYKTFRKSPKRKLSGSGAKPTVLRLDIKGKIDKMGHIEIKNFCSVKAQGKRMKRQTKNQEKIFTNHISNKGLLSRIYKALSKLNSKKQKLQ